MVEYRLRMEQNEETVMLTVIVYLFPAKPKALALIERAKAETPTIKISNSTANFSLSSLGRRPHQPVNISSLSEGFELTIYLIEVSRTTTTYLTSDI